MVLVSYKCKMKFKFVKYLFIIFVIAIICFAIYFINNKNKNNPNKSLEPQENSTQYAKDLKFGIANFDTINPLISSNKDILNLDQLIFEPLVKLKNDYKIELCLATEYAKTTPTTYIIKIDTTVKWQNGTYLSASDIAYTIAIIKQSNSIYLENVKNIVSTEVIDNSTLKIELEEETPLFEYNLVFPIVCKNYYNGEDYFTSSKLPIGTGMFQIASVNENSITLEKNQNWNNIENENSICENIYIYLFSGMGEVYNSFKIGNIDFINTSNMTYTDYIGTIGYYIKEYKGRNLDFFSLNCKDSVLSDKYVRKAINYAIDKDNIISIVYNNSYYVSEYPIDFGTFVYTNQTTSSGYNPEQAKAILNENRMGLYK